MANPSEKLKVENPLRTTLNTPSHRILFKPSSILRADDAGKTEASVVCKCVSAPYNGSGLPATAFVVNGTTGEVDAVMVRGYLLLVDGANPWWLVS